MKQTLICLGWFFAGFLLWSAPSGLAQTRVPEKTQTSEEMVTIQCPNNPVTDVLAYYERYTGKRLIKDANLTGANLCVVVAQPIPKSEAIQFIEASLLLNGYSLVPSGKNSVKVVNANAGKMPSSEAVPLYRSISALPEGDGVVSYLMPFRYMSSADAITVFQSHVKLHNYGSLVAVPGTQALLITENASVIRHFFEVQESIDLPPAKVLSEFVTLERADAERVAEIITKLLETRANQPAGAPAPPSPPAADGSVPVVVASVDAGTGLYERNLVQGDVKLVPDPRTNRILVVTRPVNMDYIRNLIKELDIATKLSQPLEVRLKFIAAADALPLLQNMLAEGKDGGGAGGSTSTGGARTSAPNTPTSGSGSSLVRADRLSAPSGDVAPESITVGKTRIIADKAANSILVLGPPESMDKVRMVLAQLDRRPLQVYLSTVIGQYTLGDNVEFGVDLLQKFATLGDQRGIASASRNRNGAADLVPAASSLISSGTFPLPAGLTIYSTFGRTLDMYVKALASDNHFKIISRPVIYATNNKKASISSGQKIAVPTSSLSSLSTGTTNNTAVTATIDFKDVVLKLEVIPLINADKEVTLQISQQDDTIVGSQTIGGNSVPTIGTQDVNTTVTVPNRATVVLGGLITETKSANETGVPFLKDIPLIGYLFKDRQKSNQRAMLLILIQPTVIETPEELAQAQREENDRVEVSDDTKKMAAPPPAKIEDPEEKKDDSEEK